MYLKFSVLFCSYLLLHAKHVIRVPPDSKELSDAEWQEAMKIESGEYTPMTFKIVNAQFGDLEESEACNDNYIKCLVSQPSPPDPACGYHRAVNSWGKFRFTGYCDLYLDNCRRGMRYWKLLGFGLCNHPTGFGWGMFGAQFDIIPSRRRRRGHHLLPNTRNDSIY